MLRFYDITINEEPAFVSIPVYQCKTLKKTVEGKQYDKQMNVIRSFDIEGGWAENVKEGEVSAIKVGEDTFVLNKMNQYDEICA